MQTSDVDIEFRGMLLESIGETIHALPGDKPQRVLFKRLGNDFHLKREEIPIRLDDFERALTSLFGSGAPVIRRAIARCRCTKLQIPYNGRKDYSLEMSTEREGLAMKRRSIRGIFVFVLILQLVAASSAMAQDTPYDFTLKAFCEVTQTELSVQVWMDGSWTQYTTPHTFTGLVGPHYFNVPPKDEHGHFVFPYLEQGIEINMASWWQFDYRAKPLIYPTNSPDVYLDSTTQLAYFVQVIDNTAESTINYRVEGPIDNPKAQPSIVDQGTITIVGSTLTVDIRMPPEAHVGTYAFRIDGVTGGNSWSYDDPNAPDALTFKVLPKPLKPSWYEPLSRVTQFTAGSVEYSYYENPYTQAAVIYVGGGQLGGVVGVDIHGESSVGGLDSGNYRLVYNLVINGFSVAAPSSNWSGADFPAQAADYLKGQGKADIYIVGFSAGGTVAAYQIINYPSLYKKAVISDAVLTKENGSGFKVADLAPKAAEVVTPHCLIWGEADNHAPFSDAEAWLANAHPGLAQLHVYNYLHEWFGTSYEPAIIENIINFLNGKTLLSQDVNVISPYGDVSTYTFHVRTNGAISNVAYDAQNLTLSVEKPQGGDDVFMVPKSMLNGDVSIQVDGQQAAVNTLENSTDYFFYLDYPAGSHSIKIMEGSPVPEFSSTWLITAVAVLAVVVFARSHTKRRPD